LRSWIVTTLRQRVEEITMQVRQFTVLGQKRKAGEFHEREMRMQLLEFRGRVRWTVSHIGASGVVEAMRKRRGAQRVTVADVEAWARGDSVPWPLWVSIFREVELDVAKAALLPGLVVCLLPLSQEERAEERALVAAQLRGLAEGQALESRAAIEHYRRAERRRGGRRVKEAAVAVDGA